MNLTPSDPQDFYQEEEEIIFDRAPQPEQEQRLSKHELKGRVYKKIVWIWGRFGYVFKFNIQVYVLDEEFTNVFSMNPSLRPLKKVRLTIRLLLMKVKGVMLGLEFILLNCS